MDQNGRPIRAIITAGTTADCSQAEELIPGIQAQYLLADRGYDRKAILQKTNPAEMRQRVENAFWHLKRWRGMARGYGKNSDFFSRHSYTMSIFMGDS